MPPGAAACASCGAFLPESRRCRDLLDELSVYSMTRLPERFIHQHVVDAYAAQHAGENPGPVATAAGLIGLHLFVERDWTGRQVQRAHMELGNRMKTWPALPPPADLAAVNVRLVLAAPEGTARDRMIDEWARAVWRTWSPAHARIRERMAGPFRVRGLQASPSSPRSRRLRPSRDSDGSRRQPTASR